MRKSILLIAIICLAQFVSTSAAAAEGKAYALNQFKSQTKRTKTRVTAKRRGLGDLIYKLGENVKSFFSTVTHKVTEFAKSAYNTVIHVGEQIAKGLYGIIQVIRTGIRAIAVTVLSGAAFVLTYMWNFLVRNTTSIHNSMLLINLWISSPANMLLSTIVRGIKYLFSFAYRQISRLFNNNTDTVETNLQEVKAPEPQCIYDPVNIAKDDSKLAKVANPNEVLDHSIYAYNILKGMIRSIIIDHLPKKLPGDHNKEKNSNTPNKKEEKYIDPDTGKEVDPNNFVPDINDAETNPDFNEGGAWDNSDPTDDPFENDQSEIVEPIAPPNPNGGDSFDSDTNLDFNEGEWAFKRRKYRKTVVSPLRKFRKRKDGNNGIRPDHFDAQDYVAQCRVESKGAFLIKLAGRIAEVCAAYFFDNFRNVGLSIVNTLNQMHNVMENTRTYINTLNEPIRHEIGYVSDKPVIHPSDLMNGVLDVVKSVFGSLGHLVFDINTKKVGSLLVAIKDCTITYGDEIVNNFGEYGKFLAENTSMLPINAFIKTLPGFKEISSIFSIVLTIFNVWRILSFPDVINYKLKNNFPDNDIKNEYLVYGATLTNIIIQAFKAAITALGIAGVVDVIGTVYFIGVVLIGLVRKGKQVVTSLYNKITKGEVQQDILTEPNPAVKDMKRVVEHNDFRKRFYTKIRPNEISRPHAGKERALNQIIQRNGISNQQLNDSFVRQSRHYRQRKKIFSN